MSTDNLDYRNWKSKNDLDRSICGPELPKDEPADFCLDQLGAVKVQLEAHVGQLLAGKSGAAAAFAYLQGVVRRCVEAGIAEWLEQENNPSTWRGDEAVISLFELVTGTMVGAGGQVMMSARQVALHAWAILYLLEKTPLSQTEIGEKLGYTRANVCAVVKRYQRDLELRKSRGMKSDEAVEIYRERAKLSHAKRKKKGQQTCKSAQKFNSTWTSMSQALKPQKPAPMP